MEGHGPETCQQPESQPRPLHLPTPSTFCPENVVAHGKTQTGEYQQGTPIFLAIISIPKSWRGMRIGQPRFALEAWRAWKALGMLTQAAWIMFPGMLFAVHPLILRGSIFRCFVQSLHVRTHSGPELRCRMWDHRECALAVSTSLRRVVSRMSQDFRRVVSRMLQECLETVSRETPVGLKTVSLS